MKIAMMTFILTAVMSVSSYAAGSYNAVAAYGACQEDGLKGVHYALEGDCPNWEAWKTNHMRAQAPNDMFIQHQREGIVPTNNRTYKPNSRKRQPGPVSKFLDASEALGVCPQTL